MSEDPWDNESEWDSPPTRPTANDRPPAAPSPVPVEAPPNHEPPMAIPPVEQGATSRRGRRRAQTELDELYEEDVEDFPPPRRGRGFLVFLLFCALIVGGSLYGVRWMKRQIDPPGPAGETISVTIPNNTPTVKIGKILHSLGVIGDPRAFRYYAQWRGKGGFEAGQYKFQRNDTFDSVLSTLTRGPQVADQQKVTFPEGFRLTQFAERVGAKLPGRTTQRFLQVVSNGAIRSSVLPAESENLEGFLFPATYEFLTTDKEEDVAAKLVDSFDIAANEEGLSGAQAKIGRTPYEALIVASLIEREAKIDEDRGKVAQVIYNRLKAGQALQIDATLIYGMGGNIDRVLFEDLKKDGPYNTYTRKGLPPTPIASPGRESIRAALNPTPGDWLYYVVVDSAGHHAFASTFKEHKKNIKLAVTNGVR